MKMEHAEDDRWMQAALAEVEALVSEEDGRGKHSQAFTTLSSRYHLHKARGHAEAYRAGVDQDPDSRMHTLAHAAARTLFALACALKDDAATG